MFDNFHQLKLRNRILAGYAVPMLLMLGIASLAYVGTMRVKKQFDSVEAAHTILDDTKDLNYMIVSMHRSSRGYLLAKNETSLKRYGEALQKFTELSESLKELIKDPEQQKNLAEITALGEQVDQYNKQLIALVDAGKVDQAIAMWSQGEAQALVGKQGDLALQLEERETELLEQRVDSVLGALNALNLTIFLGVSIALLLAIGLGLWVASAISKTISETIARIASTSSEIATTATQQESAVSEQASSVSQTTTTMEELGASTRQSAEQAEASATGARQALNLAEEGNKAVDKTFEGISSLKNQVGSIAEQIMRLSEQTSQIGLVSELVGNLANQTNMLALNAAVEAARAGEQGKGFSVVAGEIRTLADQSKKSAEKINALVRDIQAAINSTVMVTDEGTKKADVGIKLTRQTAETFAGLAEAVNHVFLNSQQISLTAKQQAVAIQQVVSSMNELDLGAKETASGINQIKSSLQQLEEAAQKMKAVV